MFTAPPSRGHFKRHIKFTEPTLLDVARPVCLVDEMSMKVCGVMELITLPLVVEFDVVTGGL